MAGSLAKNQAAAAAPGRRSTHPQKCQSVVRMSHKILEMILNHRIAELSLLDRVGVCLYVGVNCWPGPTGNSQVFWPPFFGVAVEIPKCQTGKLAAGAANGKWQPETCRKPDISSAGCHTISQNSFQFQKQNRSVGRPQIQFMNHDFISRPANR